MASKMVEDVKQADSGDADEIDRRRKSSMAWSGGTPREG